MTIECYYYMCPHHEARTELGKDAGPFCDMPECVATVEDIKLFQMELEKLDHELGG